MNISRYAVLGLLFVGIAVQPFHPVVVNGISMSPTFTSGQLVAATSNLGILDVGDVVVFRHEGEYLIKRIAFTSDNLPTEYYVVNRWQLPANQMSERSLIRQRVPARRYELRPDQVYVLGDNSAYSTDSRDFGPVAVADISAKIIEGQEHPAPTPRFPLVARR